MISTRRKFSQGLWDQALPLDMDSDSTLILAFYDGSLDWSQVAKELSEKFPKSLITGCSSSGEIYGTFIFDQSFCISIIKFEKTKIAIYDADITPQESSYQVGSLLKNKILSSDQNNLKSIFILSDGLNVNGTELANGIGGNTSVIVSGGLAGDGPRFTKTSVLLKSQLSSKKVIAIAFFSTNLSVTTGSFGGWDNFGPPRKVTSAKGNVLFTVDDQPALTLYKTYLGEEAKNLPASALLFPLSITHAGRSDIVRTILSVDESNQSMTFAGDIPEGATVKLMRANFSRIIGGSAKAGEKALQNLDSKSNSQRFCLAISCVGRRLILGEKTEDELEALQETLGPNTDLLGFYSYGELSPNQSHGCELHNQTMTVTVFQENS